MTWLSRLLPLLCLMAAVAGCGSRAATPTPIPPTATVAATLTAPTPTIAGSLLPTVTPPPAPTAGPVTFTSPRYGYVVALPCCWIGLPAPAVALETALAELSQPQPPLTSGELAGEFAPETVSAALELVAILPDEQLSGVPRAQLTVSVLPSAGLTLAQYLEATAAELGNMAQTEVQATRLDPAYHPGQMPAAVIEYSTAVAERIAGLQVALYLPDTDNLLVLTFTTPEVAYPDLAPTFAEIVRQVQLAPPA
jgi:hypothetical protein